MAWHFAYFMCTRALLVLLTYVISSFTLICVLILCGFYVHSCTACFTTKKYKLLFYLTIPTWQIYQLFYGNIGFIAGKEENLFIISQLHQTIFCLNQISLKQEQFKLMGLKKIIRGLNKTSSSIHVIYKILRWNLG